jgi:hypothetical protein
MHDGIGGVERRFFDASACNTIEDALNQACTVRWEFEDRQGMVIRYPDERRPTVVEIWNRIVQDPRCQPFLRSPISQRRPISGDSAIPIRGSFIVSIRGEDKKKKTQCFPFHDATS